MGPDLIAYIGDRRCSTCGKYLSTVRRQGTSARWSCCKEEWRTIESEILMAMKKENRSEEISCGACPDAEFVRRYPAVCDYLSTTKWDDGTPRRTSTIMLMVEDGAIKACLNDRDGERSLWRAGETFGDAIAALEAALKTDTQDWRRWNQSIKIRRGK